MSEQLFLTRAMTAATIPSTAHALRKFRIIAVPLTRPRRPGFGTSTPKPTQAGVGAGAGTGSGLNSLTYYQFQITAKKARKSSLAASSSGEQKTEGEASQNSSSSRWQWPEEGIVQWATTKAADTWAGFGKAKGGWKLKVYHGGEKLVDRLDFEELALKSIDPSLGPSLSRLSKGQGPAVEEKDHDADGVLKIPLMYPPSIPGMALSSSKVLSELRAYTEHRIPRHKRGFIFWMVLAPFTAPFMIVPIVPNLPFFFCVWRSWSNYKAYKSSQYLQSLLDHNVIVPEANEALDKVYKLHAITSSEDADVPSSSASSSSASSSSASSSSNASPPPSSDSQPQHDILLTRDALPDILAAFEFPPDGTAAADLYRAVEQARVRVKSGRAEL